MINKLLIILLLLTSVKNYSQTYSKLTSDKDIISFLNWQVKNSKTYSKPTLSFKRKISYNIIKWDSMNFIPSDSLKEQEVYHSILSESIFKFYNRLDTIFNKSDEIHFKKEYLATKDSVWKHKISHAKLTEKKRRKKKETRYYYSIPLFSKDKNYAIIKIEYYCGNTCAHGGIYIYKKTNTKSWDLIKVINQWMS